MGFCVCGGAVLQCSFGAAPSVLMVTPQNRCMTTMPIATIMDNKPFLNILPFAMCNSMANPTVMAATAAALGVLTPMPCIPSIVAPWTPGSPTVMLANFPVLNDASMLTCLWGGVIQIKMAGQLQIMVK